MSDKKGSGAGAKLCVTSQGNTLESAVDPRFGRCKYFVIVDADNFEFEAIENPNIDSMGGAGIQSGQLIASKHVTAVLTGNVGPNAFQTLSAAGVQVFTGASGSVKEAVEKYKRGEFKAQAGPSVGSHSGMPKKNKEQQGG